MKGIGKAGRIAIRSVYTKISILDSKKNYGSKFKESAMLHPILI
jgi:hypothetical protein